MRVNADALVLSLSAFAPAGVVHAFVYVPDTIPRALIIGGISLAVALLAIFCIAMWRRRGIEQLPVTQIKPIGSEALTLFVTYAVPLMAPVSVTSNPYATIMFVLILVFVLSQSRLVAGNPLLTLLGYAAFEVVTSSGVTYTVLRRRTDYTVVSTTLTVIRVGDVWYLEKDEQ